VVTNVSEDVIASIFRVEITTNNVGARKDKVTGGRKSAYNAA
jgi:hypothetical protein